MTTLTINDRKVQVPAGASVLDAATAAGERVPTLCHIKELFPSGACRMCVVEVKGRPGLVPSCACPAEEGMVVDTRSPRVVDSRRTIIQLLLASHPFDCLTCVKNGYCELQSLASEYGIDRVPFQGKTRHHYDDFSSPSIIREPDKCILCGRCVRICEEVQTVAAIDFTRRGFDTMVLPPFEMDLSQTTCVNCGQCTLACPTGALSFRQPSRADLVSAIAQIVDVARDEGVAAPVLVVHAPETASAVRATPLPAAARAFAVAALPAFGEELWLAALALGAAGVVLVADASLPSDARNLLAARVSLARDLIAAVGARPARIACVAPEYPAAAVAAAVAAANPAARRSAPNPRAGKRSLLFAALDTLAEGQELAPVSLAPGSPLGDVEVARDKCTLCHACVNLCPTDALVADVEPLPRLSFVEANCVQCGLCAVGCPEHAITLRPRLATDVVARRAARMLREDDLARCTSCGAPFIGRRLLASSLARVADFPGLASTGGVEQLKLCPACRQREALDSGGG